MDRDFRRAEQAFFRDPDSLDTFIRYWSARTRAGMFLELSQLRPEHSCAKNIEDIILQNNELITVFGVSLDTFFEQLTELATDHVYYYADGNNDIVSDFKIVYIGWLPEFFTLANSTAAYIREQKVANGVLVLIACKINGEDATYASYCSLFFDIDGNLTVDLESISNLGKEEIALVQEMSCRNQNKNQLPKARLTGRRFTAITRLGAIPPTLNDILHTLDEQDNYYLPLIDILANSPFNR